LPGVFAPRPRYYRQVWGGAGIARPHLSRISVARKSVVAVAGERCVLIDVRYVSIAAKFHRAAE
jgi:hypothetical protein